ncbi:MAG TPA: S49 family peptidase [Pseudonocardiaceae bacterium]|jgi:signal peptide peptidase SppA
MNMTEKLAAKLPVLNERVDRRPVVAVVRLQGVISPSPSPMARGTINLNVVESALKRAFDHERLLAVALSINSPGGAPTQSALVTDRIRQLAADKKVPVLAFCEDVAASGGYWLACAADEIYAHPTSMVGSIGVVSAGFGFTGLLERFGVQRRVHTAGAHKVRLDPFSPESDEDVEWLRGLHTELHEQFIELVKERRKGKLTGTDEDLFSGEVWTGKRALELGLVDGLGSLRGVLAKRFGDAHIVTAEPRRALLARLGIGGAAARLGFGESTVESLLNGLEARATWSRFGL